MLLARLLTWTGKWPTQVNVHVKEERTLAEFTHILCIYQNGVHFIHGLILAPLIKYKSQEPVWCECQHWVWSLVIEMAYLFWSSTELL